MEYRKLPKGAEKVSVIGFGTSGIHVHGEKEGVETIREAIQAGVNFFDLAGSDARAFSHLHKALDGNRDQVCLQMHFGAEYTTGQYGWTTNPDRIRRSIDWQLRTVGTDYMDFGFIHCIDEPSDLERYLAGGVLEYIKELKNQNVVRHIGLSSHNPEIVEQVLDMGILDIVMFSINPAYDYQKGDYAFGAAEAREKMYRRCVAEQVGITVMKPFSGGLLLDARFSPFGQALTETQCIQYALDKPGVLTVLPGIRGREDLKRVLRYLEASPEERDYSVIGRFTPAEAEGRCVYCGHCHPCPKGLDIAMINKYYDLAKVGDALAADHYRKLSLHAADCSFCGHCEKRCPFHVKQMDRMKEIAEYFGI